MSDDKRSKSKSLISLSTIVASMLLAGCASDMEKVKPGTYEGSKTPIGQGEAHSFVTIGENGTPTKIGVKLSESALSGLPMPATEHEYEYNLPLPPELFSTGYRQIVIGWNPHGHIPVGVYDTPHFDFHFYLIDSSDRKKITAVGDDLARAHKAPPEQYMPTGYILPPGTEVPNMGAHAVNPQGDEFTKHSFTKTFIYGFYDGQMIFVEPMITKAYLETKPDVHSTIAVPHKYSSPAHYPTSYVVVYNQANREYEISLENLVLSE
ncbi:DUF5602 domain-containing protein [Vibrio sp. YIC-376]|uniref:DUF5602 domain-containing protein n=1 Tax=Vibrio sp. YIC-376 TaxID=3136162 RepID=UPI00402AC64A